MREGCVGDRIVNCGDNRWIADVCPKLLSLSSTMIVEGLDNWGGRCGKGCVDNSIRICLLKRKSSESMRGDKNDAERKWSRRS